MTSLLKVENSSKAIIAYYYENTNASGETKSKEISLRSYEQHLVDANKEKKAISTTLMTFENLIYTTSKF